MQFGRQTLNTLTRGQVAPAHEECSHDRAKKLVKCTDQFRLNCLVVTWKRLVSCAFLEGDQAQFGPSHAVTNMSRLFARFRQPLKGYW